MTSEPQINIIRYSIGDMDVYRTAGSGPMLLAGTVLVAIDMKIQNPLRSCLLDGLVTAPSRFVHGGNGLQSLSDFNVGEYVGSVMISGNFVDHPMVKSDIWSIEIADEIMFPTANTLKACALFKANCSPTPSAEFLVSEDDTELFLKALPPRTNNVLILILNPNTKARKRINAGDEITVDYGPGFSDFSFEIIKTSIAPAEEPYAFYMTGSEVMPDGTDISGPDRERPDEMPVPLYRFPMSAPIDFGQASESGSDW